MKKINILKKGLSGLLTAVMVAGLVPFYGLGGVKADNENDTDTIKSISFDTSFLAPSDGKWASASDYKLYFGQYNGKPTAFRVLKSGNGEMMLDCDTVLIEKKFDADGSLNEGQQAVNNTPTTWTNSDLEIWLNGGDYYGNSSVFTGLEKNIIKHTQLTGGGSGHTDTSATDYVYLLSYNEVNSLYAEQADRGKTGSNDYWWLRTAWVGGTHDAVAGDGGINNGCNPTYAGEHIGVSPALNIYTSSVLFASESTLNKSSTALTKVSASTAKEWKLTLLDTAKSVQVPDGKAVGKLGNAIVVPYKYSGSGVSQISVMITSKEYTETGAEVLYYGKLDTTLPAAGSEGSGMLTLPNNLPEDYVIYILAEDANGNNLTDYASAPVKITVTNTVYTLKSDSVDISSDEESSNTAEGHLESTSNELTSTVLTDADKAEVALGSEVKVWVDVADISDKVSQENKKLIEDSMAAEGEYNVGMYLDVNLWKKVGNRNASKVTDVPKGKVKIGITIPQNLQQRGRIYKIVRVHDGITAVLDVILDSATYRITFETDGFSTYALIYSDNAGNNDDDSDDIVSSDNENNNKLVADNSAGSSAAGESKTTEATAPKTGDSNSLTAWVLGLLASLGGMTILGFSKKKQTVSK